MIAICINNKPLDGCYNEDLEHLIEGDPYEGYIEKTCMGPDGKTREGFVVPPIDPNGAFDLRRFLPTSDIDEIELVNEKVEATA